MGDAIGSGMLESVRKLAFALDKFEPFPRAVIPGPTLHRLVESGLVEVGRSCRPAVAATGYRLTTKGWQLANDRWTERSAELCSG